MAITYETVLISGLLIASFSVFAALWAMSIKLKELANDLETTEHRLTQSFSSVSQSVTTVTASGQSTLQQVASDLAALRKSSDSLANQTQSLAELRDAFRLPGPRGSLGELLLENLLRDILPADAYETQYQARSGERVDAIIKIAERIVPIDSKFPITNQGNLDGQASDQLKQEQRQSLLKAAKSHINSVKKYVKPEEGTVDYAIMYIPGENIFHQLITQDRRDNLKVSVARYAQESKVIIASPNTLYLYLQTITLALRGFAVQENAREIVAKLQGLGGSVQSLADEVRVMGNHLRNAQQKHDEAQRLLHKLSSDIDQTDHLLPKGE